MTALWDNSIFTVFCFNRSVKMTKWPRQYWQWNSSMMAIKPIKLQCASLMTHSFMFCKVFICKPPKITTDFTPEEYYYETISLRICWILYSSHYFKEMQEKEQTYILTLWKHRLCRTRYETARQIGYTDVFQCQWNRTLQFSKRNSFWNDVMQQLCCLTIFFQLTICFQQLSSTTAWVLSKVLEWKWLRIV